LRRVQNLSIQLDWSPDRDDVLLCQFLPGWTWTDYIHILEIEKEMVGSPSPTPYYVIADFSATSSVPIGNAFGHVRNNVTQGTANNRVFTVVVSRSMYVRMLVNTALKSWPQLGKHMSVADSLEAAYQQIDSIRSERGKSKIK
jgi:hypothetical protein